MEKDLSLFINLSILGREFMSLSQKYEERAQKFYFFAQHHFRAELYHYIYTVIFGKHMSEFIRLY